MKTYALPFLLFFVFVLLSCHSDTGKKNLIEVEINPEKSFQTIEGFGTCLITYKDYPPEYNDPAFFDLVVNDLGLSLMRIPVMEHTEWQNDNDDPDDFSWNGFYMLNNHRRKGMKEQMELYREFKKRGVNRFMATPWSPPQFVKTNRAPIKGGFMRADMTEEFAEFLAAYIILAKRNWDIDINWMSIQNELLFAQFFRSCVYHPYILRETVRAVDLRFKQEGISTKILMPEDMMFPNRMLNYIEPTMNDPETKDFQGHFSTHRKAEKNGLLEWVSKTEQYNRQNWMTETSGHDANWKGAFKMAGDIHNYLVYGNFSAWVYWQLSGGTGGDPEKEGKYTLLVAGKPTPKYYAAKHFYKFIRPGAVRVRAAAQSDSVMVSAFKHPVNGTLTIVLINKKQTPEQIKLNIQGENVPQSFEAYSSTGADNWIEQGPLQSAGPFNIPAKGIMTLVGSHKAWETKEKTELPKACKVDYDDNDMWGNFEALNIDKEWQRMSDGDASLLKEAKKAVKNGTLQETRFNGWTILHDAILQGDGDAVEFLLANGANVNAPSNNGWTPLHVAAASNSGNDRMITKNKDYNKYDIFKLVIEANPDVNVSDKDGLSPLHVAVANAYTGWRQDEKHAINKIHDLIEKGADIQATDKNGRTPLHWACWQGYAHFKNGIQIRKPDVVNTLIKKGANINVQDKKGNTPLHYAGEMGFEKSVYSLIQAGADENIANNANKKPSELAEKRGLENITYIIKNKKMPETDTKKTAEANQAPKGKYGQELVDAAWNGDIEKVRELLDKGADINYVDRDGFKAIDRARDNGHNEIVKLLEEVKQN
jgi:glucuronoarabinoxylan endo-1,4-beta-xylanase